MNNSTKTILITGATSGIGAATARILAKDGHSLILTGRRNKRLESLKNDICKAYNTSVVTLCFDVAHKEAVKKATEVLHPQTDKIDVLINNAGLALGLSPIDEGLTEDWEQMLDTNVKGLLYVTKYMLPLLKKSPTPHIINIGSIAGKETYPNGNVYCASKHAVDSLTKAMRIDLLKHGIKVSQVCPGATETEFSEVRFKGDKEKAKRVYEGFKALTGDDIAGIIRFIIDLPAHVNVNDMLVMPTAQASGVIFNKNN